ncbi:MAG: PAS domain S-box protein [bacterium]|nr:PAS domain S-box protein [bacterium]
MPKKLTYDELEQRILELECIESELKRSNDEIMKFRVITDNAVHGSAIAELDGTIVYLNEYFAKVHGYTPDELTGKNLSIFHNEKQLVDIHRINKILIETGNYKALEVWHTHKDGTEFPMIMNAVVIHDDNGEPVYLGATAINVTKHKQAETLLQTSRSSLIRAQFLSKTGDFSWELSSGAVTWSEGMHKLLKYDLNEEIDYVKVNSAIHHPDDLESVTKWLNDSIASGNENIVPKEYRLICKDGEVIYVHTEGEIEYEDGKAVRLFGICQDITERKRSEERLQESQEEHRLLFESMLQGVVYQDATGSIISANPAAQSLLGLSLDQMCGLKSIDPRWKAVHDDGSDFPGETHPAMVALETGEPVRDVIMGIYNPVIENHTWIKVHAIPQFKPNEKTPYLVFTTFEDITESSLIEKALKNKQSFLNRLIDQSPFATWVSDEKGTIIRCNAALENILNVTKEQLIDKYNVFEDKLAIKQGIMPKIRTVFEDGKTANFSVAWDTKELGNKDSKKVHIEGTMFPIHDDKGNLTNVVNHWVDITERQQAEEKLVANKNKTTAMLKDLLIGLVVYNQDTSVIFCNKKATEILGLTFDQMSGKKALDPRWNFLHEDLTVMQVEDYPVSKVASTGKPFSDYTLGITRPDREYVTWVIVNAIPVFSEKNKLEEIAVNFFDITDKRQVEQDRLNFEKQILQTQKLESLGVLAGGIAHDFNNILMAILGYADLALSELDSFAPAREFVQGINDSSKKAAGLVKQMLAYSGKGKFSLEPIDLNHLIDDTVQMLKISISKNSILKFNYSDTRVFLEGDPSQLRQIIMNLVINASDAIGKKSGVIAVSTGSMYCDRDYIENTGFEVQIAHTVEIPEGMYTFVEVSDTGTGMSQETLTRIFEPFFTTKFTGRGLGLSALLGIVRGHNGMVKIYSEEGKGSTFKVLFPLFETTDCSSVLDGLDEDQDWQAEGTFLIADDEEAVRTIGKHMLKKLGFEVLTAADGHEAIGIYKEHQGDIVGVLLDLTMPHKDGAEVFREIRKLNPAVKVILTSGYNEQDATQRFIGKGLAGFIQKPFVSNELVKKIIEVMETT